MDNSQLPPPMIPPEQKREEQWTMLDSVQMLDLVATTDLPGGSDTDPAAPIAVPTSVIQDSANAADLADATADSVDLAAPAGDGVELTAMLGEIGDTTAQATEGAELAAAAADSVTAPADGAGLLGAVGDLANMVSEIELPDVAEMIGSLIEGIGDLFS